MNGDIEAAIECVASIPSKWDADGTPIEFMFDKADARLIVESLLRGGHMWNRAPRESEYTVDRCYSPASPDGDHMFQAGYDECVYCGHRWNVWP